MREVEQYANVYFQCHSINRGLLQVDFTTQPLLLRAKKHIAVRCVVHYFRLGPPMSPGRFCSRTSRDVDATMEGAVYSAQAVPSYRQVCYPGHPELTTTNCLSGPV